MPERVLSEQRDANSSAGDFLRTASRPAAPELAKEPSLSVSQDELHPGITVHIAVADPLPDMGELVVQAPQHTWHQFARDAREGFNVPLAVAGSYRLTLRQPREDGEWREQAHLTVEVPE